MFTQNEKPKNDARRAGITIHLSWGQLVFIGISLLAAMLIWLILQPGPLISANPPAPEETVVIRAEVDSAQGWQATGLRLQLGQRFSVEYLEGDWSIFPMDSIRYTADGGASACGSHPDCIEPIPNYTKSGLIGRIGDGEPFPVGSYLETAANASGMLQLRVNDAGTHDNQGVLMVFVSTAP